MMARELWNLPSEPGTVISIGDWWLVRLPPYEGAPSAWELLPARSTGIRVSMTRAGAHEQCIYGDDWVFSEADQEGGYFIISEPVQKPYGPSIRIKPEESADAAS